MPGTNQNVNGYASPFEEQQQDLQRQQQYADLMRQQAMQEPQGQSDQAYRWD